jgi:glycosyltransferase involved in cell wall biosynthesis
MTNSSITAIAVIIPALNEAGNIRSLVEEVRSLATVEVIVVDNGSTDATADEAAAGGALVVSEPRRGYGYACAAGVAVAGADLLVFLDGDYSFLPADLPVLLAPMLDGSADMVLGSRLRGGMEAGAMPPHQHFGNWLVAQLMRRLYRLPITDLGPYRVIRSDLLARLHMREMTYGWPTEMIVKAARLGARIAEVPVRYHNRRAGQSKVSGTVRGTLLAAWFILGVTLRYAWGGR